MAEIRVEDGVWAELESQKAEFQKIVRLLVEFDERTGRYRRFEDPENHFMRKAISIAQPELLRVFLRHLGGFVYFVVTELNTEHGSVSTSWVHEDGIQLERDEFGEQESHPVHSILCLTDLYREKGRRLGAEIQEIQLNSATALLLMAEDGDGGRGNG